MSKNPLETGDDVRTGLGVEALKKSIRDNLHYVPGQVPGGRHAQRLLHGPGLHGPRPAAAPLGPHCSDVLRTGQPHRRLPLRRVSARPAARQQPHQPGHLRAGPAGDGRSWAWT